MEKFVGRQNNSKGSNLELDPKTPTTAGAVSTYISGYRQSHIQNVQEKGHLKGQKNPGPESPIHSPEERFTRRKIDNGSVLAQQVHRVPDLQDAHPERNQLTPTHGLLDSQPRPQGWLLASQYLPQTETLPGLQIQKPNMAVQSYALWPKYSPKDLYKAHSTHGKGHGFRRNMVSPISRRPTHSSSFPKRMPSEVTKSHGDPRRIWMDHQQRKIKNRTSTGLPMAGSPLRPGKPYQVSHTRQFRLDTQSLQKYCDRSEMHQEGHHEIAGPC